jgi:hypothetical protein
MLSIDSAGFFLVGFPAHCLVPSLQLGSPFNNGKI